MNNLYSILSMVVLCETIIFIWPCFCFYVNNISINLWPSTYQHLDVTFPDNSPFSIGVKCINYWSNAPCTKDIVALPRLDDSNPQRQDPESWILDKEDREHPLGAGGHPNKEKINWISWSETRVTSTKIITCQQKPRGKFIHNMINIIGLLRRTCHTSKLQG